MCVNCGDFVDICGEGDCRTKNVRPDQLYGIMRSFYVGDVYCEHMRLRYGHEVATWEDQLVEESS